MTGARVWTSYLGGEDDDLGTSLVVDGDQVCSSFSNCLSVLRDDEPIRYSGAAANGLAPRSRQRVICRAACFSRFSLDAKASSTRMTSGSH